MLRIFYVLLLILPFFSSGTNDVNLNAIKEEIKQGMVASASAKLKKLVKLHPTSFTHHIELAYAMRKNANHAQAIAVLTPLLEFKNLSDRELFRLHTDLGINYRRTLNIEQANIHYSKAKKLAMSLNDDELLARAHANLGVLYDTQSNLAMAMQEQTSALKLLKNSSDWELQASVYYNLGDMSLRLNNLDQASYFFLNVLESDKKSGDKYNIASTSLSLARITIKQKKYKLAIKQLFESIDYLAPL